VNNVELPANYRCRFSFVRVNRLGIKDIFLNFTPNSGTVGGYATAAHPFRYLESGKRSFRAVHCDPRTPPKRSNPNGRARATNGLGRS